MKQRLTIITLLFALCVSLYFVNSRSQAAPSVQTWEYKVMVGKCWDEKKLNPLGAEGWELATYSTWGISGGPSVDTCVFKRAK